MRAGFVQGFPFTDDECHPLTITSCLRFGEALVPVVERQGAGSITLPQKAGAPVFGLLSGAKCGFAVNDCYALICREGSYLHLPQFPTDITTIVGFSDGLLTSVAVAFGRTITIYCINDSGFAISTNSFTVPSMVVDLHWTGGIDGHVVGLAENGPFTLSGSGVVATSGNFFGLETVTFWDIENGRAAFAYGDTIEVWGCSGWQRHSKHRCSFPIDFFTIRNDSGIAYSADGYLRSFTLEERLNVATVTSTMSCAPNCSPAGHDSLFVSVSGCDIFTVCAAYPFESGDTAPIAATTPFRVSTPVVALRVEGDTVVVLSRDGQISQFCRRPAFATLQEAVLCTPQPTLVDQWQTSEVLADAVWLGLMKCKNDNTREMLCDIGDLLMDPSMRGDCIELSPLVRRAMFHSGPALIQGDVSIIQAQQRAFQQFIAGRAWSDTTAAQGLSSSSYELSFPDIMLTGKRELHQTSQVALQGMVLELLDAGFTNMIRYLILLEKSRPILGDNFTSKHDPKTVCWEQPNVYHDIVNAVLRRPGGAPLLLRDVHLDSISIAKANICNLIADKQVKPALALISKFAVDLHRDGGGGLETIMHVFQSIVPEEPIEVYILCILLNAFGGDARGDAYWSRIESILDASKSTEDWGLVASVLTDLLNSHLYRFSNWISSQSVLDPRLLSFSVFYKHLCSIGMRLPLSTPMMQVVDRLAFSPEGLPALIVEGKFTLTERMRLVELVIKCNESVSIRRHLQIQQELLDVLKSGDVDCSAQMDRLRREMCKAEVLVNIASSAQRYDIQIEVLCRDGVTDDSVMEEALRHFVGSGSPLETLFERIHDYVGSIAVTLLRVVAPLVPPTDLLGLISGHTGPIDTIESVVGAVEYALQQDSSMSEWPLMYLAACEGIFNGLEPGNEAQYLAMRLGDTIRRIVGLARLGHVDIQDEVIVALCEIESRIDVTV